MEELELVQKARDGDNEAAKKLLEDNMGILKYFVKKRGHGLEWEDGMGEAYLTFAECLHSFDPEKGQPFGRWVGNNLYYSLNRARLREKGEGIAISPPTLRKALKHKSGEDVVSGKRAKDYEGVLNCLIVSGDRPIGEDTATSFFDNFSLNEDEPFLDYRALDQAINKLSKQEQQVIRLSFLMDGEGELGAANLAEIARIMDVSREYVRQIYKSAFLRLKARLKP